MTETAPSSQAPVPIPASNPVSESQPAQPLAEQEEHHPAPESTDVNATPEGTNANPSPKSTTGATNTPHSPSPTHDEADLYGLRHFSI